MALATRAMWGQLDGSIVGISVAYTPTTVELWAFHNADQSAETSELLEDALGYLAADAPVPITAELHLIRAEGRYMSAPGEWIYMRSGFIGVGPGDDRYVTPAPE
jgi:hypothetical protein